MIQSPQAGVSITRKKPKRRCGWLTPKKEIIFMVSATVKNLNDKFPNLAKGCRPENFILPTTTEYIIGTIQTRI